MEFKISFILMSQLWTMSLIHDLALGLFFEFLCVADGLGRIICLPQSDSLQ